MALKELVFYYDVICPYAYVASKLVEGLAERTGATLKWRPVLLGGIYNLIKPKEEAKKRPIESMVPAKLMTIETDLRRLFHRNGITASPHKGIPDLSSLNAMRLIVSSPSESGEIRRKITHALYDAVWIKKQDVSRVDVLQSIAKEIDWNVNVEEIVMMNSNNAKEKLFENTKESVERGAFGVPSFWLKERLYFGVDRMFFVERDLGNINAQPLRVQSTPLNVDRPRKLTIYHDVASPWTDIALHRVNDLLASCRPLKINVEYVPVLIGALFKEIGTPEFPLRFMTPNRQNFMIQDILQWIKFTGMTNRGFPSYFPFNSLTSQRLMVANNSDSKLRTVLYNAAWRGNVNISDVNELVKLLNENGYDGHKMIENSKDPAVKMQLRENTTRAINNGACGLPCFQVDDGQLMWGQDRMNEVADLLCGAKDVESFQTSKL